MVDAVDERLNLAAGRERICRRNGQQGSRRSSAPEILIIQFAIQHLHRLGVVLNFRSAEKERAVAPDRAANRAAELIADIDLLAMERINRSQLFVAEQFEGTSVELVGAGLGRQ